MYSPLRDFLKDFEEGRLLVHLDDEGHLSVPTAERMIAYAEALLEGETSFPEVAEEWFDWFTLVDGFGRSYDVWDLDEMFEHAPLGGPLADGPVTPADEAFLSSLVEWVRLYADLRREGDYLVQWREIGDGETDDGEGEL